MFALLRSQGVSRCLSPTRQFQSPVHRLTQLSQHRMYTPGSSLKTIKDSKVATKNDLSLEHRQIIFFTSLAAKKNTISEWFFDRLDNGDIASIEGMFSLNLDLKEIEIEGNYSSLLAQLLKNNYTGKEKIAHQLLTAEKKVDLEIFFLACTNNFPSLVRRMVSEYNIRINAQDEMGDTALHKAISSGCGDVAQTLINCGANIEIENKKGIKAFDLLFNVGSSINRIHLLKIFISSNPNNNSEKFTRLLRMCIDKEQYILAAELIDEVDHSLVYNGVRNLYFALSHAASDPFARLVERTENILPETDQEMTILREAVKHTHLKGSYLLKMKEKCPTIKHLIDLVEDENLIEELKNGNIILNHRIHELNKKIDDLESDPFYRIQKNLQKIFGGIKEGT